MAKIKEQFIQESEEIFHEIGMAMQKAYRAKGNEWLQFQDGVYMQFIDKMIEAYEAGRKEVMEAIPKRKEAKHIRDLITEEDCLYNWKVDSWNACIEQFKANLK